MNNLGSVIRFTFKNRFFAKSSIISTLIFVILISIGLNVPFIISQFSSGGASQTQIGIIEDHSGIAAELEAYFQGVEDSDIALVMIPDAGSSEANEQQAKALLENGEIDGYLELMQNVDTFPTAVYSSSSDLDYGESTLLTAALQTIKTQMIAQQLNLTEAQLAQINAPINLEMAKLTDAGQPVEEEREPGQTATAYILVYLMIVLLFFAVIMYGNLIATEVTAEKSSRVMEILISSISPLTQMFGKVIGMLLLGLAQLGIYFVAAVINILLPHNLEMLREFNINLGDIPVSLILAFIFFYLAGFLLYALLFAAVGSLVSRTEDLGQAITPLTFILLAAFYIGIFGMNAPDSTFMISMSYVPFFSPFLMFLRLGLGELALWEFAIGVVLLLAAIGFFGWLSAKIYRVGVLMYGKKPSWKEVRKAMKAYKV